MTSAIRYTTSSQVAANELLAFYERQQHASCRDPSKLELMITQSFCFVTAHLDGEMIGMARGVTDGVRGYLAECKLDPRFQGPACITRRDGRIEHDTAGIARELAGRVVDALRAYGVEVIHVLAHETEVDFCTELGFRQCGGMVIMELRSLQPAAVPAP